MRRAIALLPLLVLASCSHPQPQSRPAALSYVDSKLCASCHATHAQTFHQTGMGRSFYRATPATMSGHFRDGAAYYHKPSGRYYQMIQRGDQFFQRRYQKTAAGAETNVIEESIDYVMGSGNHARTYLHRTAQNRLIQLPVSWYPDGYAMSPGYDRPDHLDFRRKIGYDCYFCHNAYPQIAAPKDAPDADPVYPAQLEEGIDCQRCHGPGSAHVDAAQHKRPTADVRQAIVNPARLTPERQLEICMSCHLETTSFVLPASIQRYGRGTFSFRPGEPLSDYMLHFDHAPGTGHDDKFEIVSAAYRLRQSRCFQESAGRLVCTTCHNPHRAPRGDEAIAQYTAACLKCHQEKLQAEVARGRHPKDANCLPCHMAKRRTEDVIHAVMTDHRILRREPARNLQAPLAERHDSEGSYHGEVMLYYPQSLPDAADRDLYVAAAQVAQKSNLTAGLPQLEAAIRSQQPRQPEFMLVLAQALMASGRRDDAVAAWRTVLKNHPQNLTALRALGAALEKSGDAHTAIATLEQARALEPTDAATLHELGLAYQAAGRAADALAALQEAIRQDPDLPEIRNSLGNMLLDAGDRDQAETSFREAIRSQPDLSAAHADLGNALAAKGDLTQAENEYRAAMQLDPANPQARYGYGAALASRGRFDEAQRQIEEAVRLSPDFADAQAILGDLYARRGQWPSAMTHYREALRVRPDNGRAQLGLGTALGATHDLNGAREHLTLAARDPHPEIRHEAEDLLRQLPK
ncbi:MAG TPA: tetratricopeptide repeat protein [Bryobacteraceae bacterium]|jgi:predicted CXXCH cytochrome family protein